MKRNVRLKMCVAAMAALFMPLALYAQTDGFFSTDNGGGSRGSYVINVDNDGTSIHTTDFEPDPDPQNIGSLGGGLLIMAAAGVGYVLLKKKEEK